MDGYHNYSNPIFNTRNRASGHGYRSRGGYHRDDYEHQNQRQFERKQQPKQRKFKPIKQEIDLDMPSRQEKEKKPIVVTKEPDLTPKNLSTSFTEPKNDPGLLKESLTEGLSGFRFRSRTLEFAVDLYGLKALIEETYDAIAKYERRFSKAVSLASYSYYCNMALWRHFAFIRHSHGDDLANSFIILNNKLGTLPLPKAINQFISCIGDITDANQRKWRLWLPTLTESGDFGIMDNDNFVYYMAYPTPRISLASVIKEVHAYADNQQIMQPWGINGIMPDGFHLYSNNINGYHLPKKLSSEQHRELINMNLDHPYIDYIDGIGIHKDLIDYVRGYIETITCMEIIKENPDNQVGSRIQMAFILPSSNAPILDQINKFSNIYDKSIESHCMHQIASQAACTSIMNRLRLQRRKRTDGLPVLPENGQIIDFNNYGVLYNYGDCARWNIGDFVIGDVDANQAIVDFVHNFIKK